MERIKELLKAMADLAKMVGMVATVFGACYGAARLYAYAATRADATEVAVLKSQRIDADKKTDYILLRVDTIANQLNHLALTGRVNYVPPPPPPAQQQPLIGPEPAPGKVTP